MGFLFKLLALPITGPTNALMAIFRTIETEVAKENANPDVLKAQLVQLQRMLEDGEIDEDTYEMMEEEILDELEDLYDAMEVGDG